MSHQDKDPRPDAGGALLLRRAVRDQYPDRNKTSRDYPRKKRPDPPPGKPEIKTATEAQDRKHLDQ